MHTIYRVRICILVIAGLLLILANGCKKAEKPSIDETSGYMTDKDGNVYTSVTIGTQEWMVENLKTTKYNDGSEIPLVTANEAWAALSTPGYCWINNDLSTDKAAYGALYNWYAVDAASNGGKNVCLTGWHVPTDAEWTILNDYLTNNGYGKGDDPNLIGKALAATSGWTASAKEGDIGNDQAGNNSSGFTALPGGYRNAEGVFLSMGQAGHWRSSTASSSGKAWYRSLNYNFGTFYRNDYGSSNGYSVRCLKD